MHLLLDVIQNMLKTSRYWTVGIGPYGAHKTTPLHEAKALEARAHSLLGPVLGTKVSVSHDPSLGQVYDRRKTTGVLRHQLISHS